MYEAARKRSLRFFYLGLVCWNLAVSIDSTALSVALPVRTYDFWLIHSIHFTDRQAYRQYPTN